MFQGIRIFRERTGRGLGLVHGGESGVGEVHGGFSLDGDTALDFRGLFRSK
jgi:hypothetical protein